MRKDNVQEARMAWRLIAAVLRVYRAHRYPAHQPIPWKLVAAEAGFASVSALRNWRRRIDWDAARAVIDARYSAKDEITTTIRYGLLLVIHELEGGGPDAPDYSYISWERITRTLPYYEIAHELVAEQRFVEADDV